MSDWRTQCITLARDVVSVLQHCPIERPVAGHDKVCGAARLERAQPLDAQYLRPRLRCPLQRHLRRNGCLGNSRRRLHQLRQPGFLKDVLVVVQREIVGAEGNATSPGSSGIPWRNVVIPRPWECEFTKPGITR